jgi:hypothetical protein
MKQNCFHYCNVVHVIKTQDSQDCATLSLAWGPALTQDTEERKKKSTWTAQQASCRYVDHVCR